MRTPRRNQSSSSGATSADSGDADDIPYNAMLIGAADAHLELPLGTVDEAATAIHTELVRLAQG